MRTFLWLMRVLACRHTYIHSYTARESSRDRLIWCYVSAGIDATVAAAATVDALNSCWADG